jgi:hypothetical protein
MRAILIHWYSRGFNEFKTYIYIVLVDSDPSENDEDKATFMNLFSLFDSDHDRQISHHEMDEVINTFAGVSGQQELVNELKILIGHAANKATDVITLKKFLRAFENLPRVRRERTKWVRDLNLDAEIAKLLKAGTAFDGLKGLRELEGDEMERHILEVCAKFSRALPAKLRDGMMKLKAAGKSEVQEHINSKFVLPGCRA